jgi:hypothetical protein
MLSALVVLATTGSALADHGGRGNHGGSGGDRSSSSSFNGGGGNSFRSFSGSGGQSSSSSRSFSMGNGGGDRGASARSYSFSRGNDSSPRTFSAGSDRSFRSNGGSSNDVSRSFRGASDGGPTQTSFQQRDGRSNVDSAQLNAFLSGNSSGRATTQGDNQSQSNNSPNRKPSFYGQQLASNSIQTDSGARNIQAGRPSGEQVHKFLGLSDRDAPRIAENDNQNPNGKGHGDGGTQQYTFRSRGGNNRDGGSQSQNLSNHFNMESKRFQSDHGPNNSSTGPSSNGVNKFGVNNSGDNGRLGKHLGLDRANGQGDFNNAGQLRNRNGSGHDFRGSDVAKSEFKQWSNTWKGKNGDGRDHRDWSGKWKNGDRFEIAHSIRGDWHDRHDHDNFPFRGGWWGNHHGHGWGFWDDYAVRYGRPYYWWGWSTCPILTSWCGFGWSTPYYWDYGPGEYIYCNDGVVYVNGVWYEPAPVFYQQTLRLVDQAPALAPEAAAQAEWLPLGVFAVTPDGLKEPSVLVQLAVTKDGIIGGTAFDQKAGKSYNIQGTVDKTSQRAVWSYMNDQNNRIVMETSVNNLTQNESTGLVHYSPNDMRVVELVRLQDPAGAPGDLPTPPPAH